MIPGIICARCGKAAPKRGNGPQKYCADCSNIRNKERRTGWAREVGTPRKRSEVTEQGLAISRQERVGMLHTYQAPDLAWLVKVSVPFDWAASKNHLYALRKAGHVALRAESASFRDALIWRLKDALQGRKVANNKVWIDLFVQKPNHRGDAINMVDLICDAVKVAVGVDDRWFSIRSVDWQIIKDDPHIYIGVGQENVEDAQACSSCGRILSPAAFQKNSAASNGLSRNCRDCGKARKRNPKAAREFDAEADAIGSYNAAVEAIGARVRAGEPVPEFMLSRKAK